MLKIAVLMVLFALFTGCASVKMEATAASENAKKFAQPASGNAGVYIYRDNSILGGALKKDVWLNGKCIGESAPGTFFHTEVAAGKHTLSTESEFSPNDLAILVDEGRNYFYRQFMKVGLVVWGAGLESVPEEQGKAAVAKLLLASGGTCSESYTR